MKPSKLVEDASHVGDSLGEVNFVVQGDGVVNHESTLELLAGILADCGTLLADLHQDI